jgi:hypothetical protein
MGFGLFKLHPDKGKALVILSKRYKQDLGSGYLIPKDGADHRHQTSTKSTSLFRKMKK